MGQGRCSPTAHKHTQVHTHVHRQTYIHFIYLLNLWHPSHWYLGCSVTALLSFKLGACLCVFWFEMLLWANFLSINISKAGTEKSRKELQAMYVLCLQDCANGQRSLMEWTIHLLSVYKHGHRPVYFWTSPFFITVYLRMGPTRTCWYFFLQYCLSLTCVSFKIHFIFLLFLKYIEWRWLYCVAIMANTVIFLSGILKRYPKNTLQEGLKWLIGWYLFRTW